MDNGGIRPGDESYFQNIRETALQDTIEQLTKELAEARTEIERLRARNAILDNAIAEMTEEQSALCAEEQSVTELVAAKDKLIEQMLDALQEVMVLCDAVPTRAHDMAKDYHLREIGRIVNVKGLYRVVKAALSAAERSE